MKHRLLLASIAVACLSRPAPAPAQFAVACVNCSDLAHQLVSYAVQYQQYLKQGLQLQTEMQQYANMVTNTIALPTEVFAGVQADITQVRNLANAASLLTGNSGSILSRLSQAGAYANQAGMTPQMIENQFTTWQQTISNSGTSLARTLGVQQGQEQNYTALQTAIQSHSQTAAGQMQAIQAGNESLALLNTQLQQVQTTLTTAAQQQATRDIVSSERGASQDAAWLRFTTPPAPLPTTGNQSFGPGDVP